VNVVPIFGNQRFGNSRCDFSITFFLVIELNKLTINIIKEDFGICVQVKG
jgi:hypothetical protein